MLLFLSLNVIETAIHPPNINETIDYYNKLLNSINQNNTLFDQKETEWAKHKKGERATKLGRPIN